MRIPGCIVKTPRLCPENPRHLVGYVLGAGLTGVPGAEVTVRRHVLTLCYA